jgi:hypothetical protein
MCHSAQIKDDPKLDAHKTELPKFEWRLAAGDKISWGDGGALVAEKDGTLTQLDKAGKPLLRFPVGFRILRTKTSTGPELILVPGEPVVVSNPAAALSAQ